MTVSSTEQDKQIHIIAGPNGAGKSSLARITLLPNFLKSNEFVNADEIAKVLSPQDPEKSAIEAGRLMLKRIDFLLSENMSFAFETTLSARIFLKLITKAQSFDYQINLIFLKLSDPQLAYQRVLTRVSKGGHNIEQPVIYRRFGRGLANLKDYLEIVDTATVYESTGINLIEIVKKDKTGLTVVNQQLWEKLYA